MYMLQSAIRQLYLIDEETLQRQIAGPEFKLEDIVQCELESVLNEAVLILNPFTFPEPTEKSLMNCQHLLDCLYTVICGHSLPFEVGQGVDPNPVLESMPSACRLKAVGIRSVGTVSTLRDVRQSGRGYLMSAKLQLPKVALYDFSESAFHNLALDEQLTSGEQCGDLRCYLQCMASLCVDGWDLQMLIEEGVINDHMGNATLLGMWDRTLKGMLTPFPSRAWVRCYRKIHQHRSARLKKWRSECWDLFFAKPWTLVSVIAAIILLFLTATLTWFTVHPLSNELHEHLQSS